MCNKQLPSLDENIKNMKNPKKFPIATKLQSTLPFIFGPAAAIEQTMFDAKSEQKAENKE